MLIRADARKIPLKDKTVQMVCTSPPFWGLRDYGVVGQIGLEKTPEEYMDSIISVSREIWRVLRDDGTLWLNLGDSYFGGGRGGNPDDSPFRKQATNVGSLVAPTRIPVGCKAKDLVGIPWRVAFALQADGWYLRSDIIWSKPNPMPESVTDRPTKAHEYIFLLSKSERYYFDQEAVKEAVTGNSHSRGNGINPKAKIPSGWNTEDCRHDTIDDRYDPKGKAFGPNSRVNVDRDPAHLTAGRIKSKQNRSFSAAVRGLVDSRNIRSVWTIATQPYSGAHFATFPREIPERCIKAGTSKKGCCPKCRAPWERITEKKPMVIRRSPRTHEYGRTRSSGTMVEPAQSITHGWGPSCKCFTDDPMAPETDNLLNPIPCIILDPFCGSGTTVMVAQDLGRIGIGIDLKYQDLAAERIGGSLFKSVVNSAWE